MTAILDEIIDAGVEVQRRGGRPFAVRLNDADFQRLIDYAAALEVPLYDRQQSHNGHAELSILGLRIVRDNAASRPIVLGELR